MKKLWIILIIITVLFFGWLHFTHAANIWNYTDQSNSSMIPGSYAGIYPLGQPLVNEPTSTILTVTLTAPYPDTCSGGDPQRYFVLYDFSNSAYTNYVNAGTLFMRWNDGSWGSVDGYPINAFSSSTLINATTSVPFKIKTSDYYILSSYCGSGSGQTSLLASAGSFGGSGAGNAAWFGGGAYAYSGTPYFIMQDGTPPSGTPTITFNFPTQGTTTAPFLYLSGILTNLTSTEQYAVTENTSYTGFLGIGGIINVPGTTMVNNGAYFTRFGYNTGFPLIQDVSPLGGTFGMTSNLQLYDLRNNTYIGTLLPINSSTITWNLLPYNNGIVNQFNGTTTIIQNFPQWIQGATTTPWNGTLATDTVTSTAYQTTINTFCPNPKSATDIGGDLLYAGCSIINLGFNPQVIPQSITYLSDSLNNLKQQPPFVAIFGLASATYSGASTASNTYNVSIGILGYPNQQQTDLVDINSTTFNNGVGGSTHTSHPTSDATNYLETFASMTLWIGAGIKVLWIFTHPT